MAREKIISDISTAITHTQELNSILSNLFYDAEFAKIVNKGITDTLLTATDFLKQNLEQMKTQYTMKG